MGMPRSLAPFFLMVLTISFVFTTARAAATESLKKACSGTTFVGTCVETLEAIPETQTANPRQVALAAFRYLVKEGEPLVLESQRELAGSKDEAVKACLTVLDANLKSHVSPLLKLTPEQSDAKFGEARDVLNSMLSIPSNSGKICTGNAISTNPVIVKIFKYESMLQVTEDLMENELPPP